MSPFVSDLEHGLRDAHTRQRTAMRRRATRVRRGAGLAGLAAALIAVAPNVIPSDPTGATLSARNVLDQAAAASVVAPSRGAVRYAKLKSVSLVTTGGFNGTYNELVPETQELWIRPDGSGRVRSSQGAPTFPTPEDKAIWQTTDQPRTHAQTDTTERSAKDLHATAWGTTDDFPTDEDALLDKVRDVGSDAGDRPRDVAAFEVATDLLMAPDASPRLRKALFKVLGHLDGVRALGRQSIADGRAGQSVGLIDSASGARTLTRVVFDPKTAQVIGRATEALELPKAFQGKAPYLLGYTTLLQSASVGRVGQRP